MKFSKTFKIIFIIVSCFYFNYAASQDIHFSQFESSPLNLSPAQTGSFNHDFRLITNHRNQWQSVTVPYLTLSASFEGKVQNKNFFKSGFLFISFSKL